MSNGSPIYAPLKNKLFRKTPHWFAEKETTYLLIEDSLNKKIHPDTLGTKFASFMEIMKMDYSLHDLRRTFITKALDLNKVTPMTVMMAVGHGHLDVTMRYIRDNRQLDDEVYVPKHKKE